MSDKWIQLQSSNGEDNLFPVGKMDLLWTNSSPSSAFGAQTIALDLSAYSMIYTMYCIAVDVADSAKRYNTCMQNVDGKPYQHASYYSGNSSNMTRRTITATTTGIIFENGIYGTSSSTNCNVPQKIYGIKMEVS